MEAVRNRVLAGELVSRAQIDALADPTLAMIDEALAALDYDRAATAALACAKKAAVPVELVARILPGIEFPPIACALIAIAGGDKAALLDALEHRRFPPTKEAFEIEAITLYGAWKAGAPLARVIPELRRLSVRTLTAEGYALLAAIGSKIEDPNVQAAMKPIAAFAKDYAKQVASDERAMTAKLDQVLASLPAEVEASRGGFTVRAGKQVGRNDPCPCGSGLKYKKCCADKPASASSPIPGLAWDEFMRGDKMQPQHVEELPLRDLVRIEFGRLPADAAAAACKRLIVAHAFDQVERMLDAHPSDDLRDLYVRELFECKDYERARAHVARLPDELAKDYALGFEVLAGGEAAWHALVAAANKVVRSADKLDDVDLAYTLLRTAPALGILAARACIGTLRVDDADLLLQNVEDARDELNLPPTDPAWDVLDELTVKDKPTSDDADKLRASVQHSTERIDQLERALSQMRTELAAERTKPAAELMRAPEKRDALDAKVRELEALIREGNEERRDLRDQLELAAAAEKRPRSEERARRPAEDNDDDVAEAIEQVGRNVSIPRFERRFTDALDEVPQAVAAEAMRTIGTLAAGDAHAWSRAKQAKDMVRPVLMARVGIHHRLCFRQEAGHLDVLDLVTRENLLQTLKRLRAQR